MRQKGIPANSLIKTLSQQSYVIDKNSNFAYCVYEFFDGHHKIISNNMDGPKFTNERNFFFNCGKFLGELHVALKEYPIKKEIQHKVDLPLGEYFRNVLKNISPSIGKINSIIDLEFVSNTIEQIETDLTTKHAKLLENEQLIHRDFHLGNLIFRQNEIIGIVDFEYVYRDVKLVDLVYFLNSLLSTLHNKAFKSDKTNKIKDKFFLLLKEFLKGYRETNLISKNEIMAFHDYLCKNILLFLVWFLEINDLEGLEQSSALLHWVIDQKSEINSCLK